MYQRILTGKKKTLGTEHTLTLNIIHNLSNLYQTQSKLTETKRIYQRALKDTKKTLGPNHTSTLITVNNLSNLYQA